MVAFRFTKTEFLERDLDEYLAFYSRERAHQSDPGKVRSPVPSLTLERPCVRVRASGLAGLLTSTHNCEHNEGGENLHEKENERKGESSQVEQENPEGEDASRFENHDGQHHPYLQVAGFTT